MCFIVGLKYMEDKRMCLNSAGAATEPFVLPFCFFAHYPEITLGLGGQEVTGSG